MALLAVLWWLALAFTGVQITTLLVNLWTFPVLRPAPQQNASGVAILIPARNEAATLPETLPRVLAQGAAVWVLDDNSEDETATILKTFAANHPHLHVLQGQALPSGWGGKNWACHQLSEVAAGDVLIFTDADVFWQPGTLDALLAFKARERAEFVSVWPRQLTKSFWERVTVPLIDQILLGALPYLGVRHLPFGSFSAGNGQLMLWTRPAYERVGGHAAFRAEVLEDVRMGQAAKAKGLHVGLSLGGAMMATRMYRSDIAMWEGFSKNILSAAGGRIGLVMAALLNTLVHSGSWLLGLVSPLWFLIGGLSLMQRLLTNFKTQRSLAETPLQIFVSLPIWRIAARTLSAKGAYSWKGRRYDGAP